MKMEWVTSLYKRTKEVWQQNGDHKRIRVII